ncbi:hypothetical protein [Hahella chejuensis]|nr:hypothetical protein [Hahella chejuensis]
MSFLAIKLREAKKPCSPVGPNFGRARPVEIILSGTRLKMLVNSHGPSAGRDDKVEPCEEYNLYDDSLYRTQRSDNEPSRYFLALCRSWGFRGPIFSGYIAKVNFAVLVQRVKPRREDFSLFNARDFEQFQLDTLFFEHGNKTENGRNLYDAPVNWKAVPRLTVPAATFEVLSAPHRGGVRKKIMAFAVEHDICVWLSFNFDRYVPGNLEEQDQLIFPEPLDEYVQRIIDSVELELSESARKDLLDVRSKHPDMSLTQVDPIKWTTPEQDAEWEEYYMDWQERKRLSIR